MPAIAPLAEPALASVLSSGEILLEALIILSY